MPDSDITLKLERTKRRLEVTDVDLSGSVFSDVNLAGTVFDDVNLSGTSIHNANLSNLRISNANLDGATINGIAVSDLLAAYRAAPCEAKPEAKKPEA